MKQRFILLAVCCILLVVLMGCNNLDFLKPKTAQQKTAAAPSAVHVKGAVIAKVNNVPITLEDLNQEITAYNNMVSSDRPEAKITTRDQKIDYLKSEMVRRTLLYQDALNKGLERKEEVIQALQKTKEDILVVELVKEMADKVEVSSKEIEDYYNTYKDQLKEPEERQIREIVVPTEQEAKEVTIDLLQGADFAALARERSKAASSKNGGDLGLIKPGQKFPQFDSVAFSDSLELGKISNIFKGPDGYYILKLEAKQGGKVRSLSEMWDDIKRGLQFLKQQQMIEDLVGNLSRGAKIEVYEQEIK